ncbi:MAG: mechanosensitive ion channel family protein [Polyangia bacterium]
MSPQQIEQFLQKTIDSLAPLVLDIGGKILGAIALWIVGRVIIGAVRRLVRRATEVRKVDATLIRYLDSVLGVMLQILLIVAILGVFGIQTTTFAGLLAAAGVAIGMAWSGLLSNFAAGVFSSILSVQSRDRISAAGIVGCVHELGLFVTAIDTDDGIRTYVANSKLFSDNIVNFSANPIVALTWVRSAWRKSVEAAARLKARLAQIPNVLKDPAPMVEIDKFNMAGTVLLVRTYTHDTTFWPVYFAMTQTIADEFTKAGYPTPAEHKVQYNK